MGKKNDRYTHMQRYMTRALLVNTAIFIFYLIFAGMGIIWLKTITAILSILISAGCLAFLFLCRELLRRRSQWMTTGAGALLLCTLVSLILNYPSPL